MSPLGGDETERKPLPRAPFLVQLEYHTGSTDAAAVAEYLHRALNDDPAVPGLRIPTLTTPTVGAGEVPEPQLAAEADRVLVVVLSDDHLVADAHTPSTSGCTWADYVVHLRTLCDQKAVHRFMPVQLTEDGWPVDSRLADLNVLRAWSLDDETQRRRLVASRIVEAMLRRLAPDSSPPEEAPPLTIFLSHTKLDLESEPRVVRSLLAHLTANQPQKTWFDSGDIEAGSRFAKEIEAGVRDGALLAVLTDSYSSRSWCRREVLLAKHYERPVVVVDAIQEREIRSFPYVGNVPVVRWNGNPQEPIDVLTREALRQAYAAECLAHRKRAEDSVLTTGPELLTLVGHGPGEVILYPDPPLGAEELAIIEKTGMVVETPLERHARDFDWTQKPLTVALSISPSEDIARYRLRPEQLETLALEVSRYLLISGMRLAYGGHLGDDGYTLRLADLLRDPVVEQLRGAAPKPDDEDTPQLTNYLPWPSLETVHSRARLGSLVNLVLCQRPDGVDESMDSLFTDPVLQEVPDDTAARRFAWARGLTEMRIRQVSEVDARVVLGGRLGHDLDWYRGRMPGVLEEALLSIDAGQPVYVAGAFGGCARVICEALEGRQSELLTWEHHRRAPFAEELRARCEAKGVPGPDFDAAFALLRDGGFECLRNGLEPAENRELATARSTERVIELIFDGLERVYGDRKEVGEQ